MSSTRREKDLEMIFPIAEHSARVRTSQQRVGVDQLSMRTPNLSGCDSFTWDTDELRYPPAPSGPTTPRPTWSDIVATPVPRRRGVGLDSHAPSSTGIVSRSRPLVSSRHRVGGEASLRIGSSSQNQPSSTAGAKTK